MNPELDSVDRDLIYAAYKGRLGREPSPGGGHVFLWIQEDGRVVDLDGACRLDALIRDGWVTYRTAHGFCVLEATRAAWEVIPW